MRLSSEYTKREVHDSAFETKFVAPEVAIAVERSSYDTIANSHRDDLAARLNSPKKEVSKPNWNGVFSSSQATEKGFFNSGWFW